MRQVKRCLSLVLALVMVLYFPVTAFASEDTQKMLSYEKATQLK